MGLGVKLSGIVINRYAHGLPLKNIKCIEAGHPVPDNAGEDAAREIYESVVLWVRTIYCYV